MFNSFSEEIIKELSGKYTETNKSQMIVIVAQLKKIVNYYNKLIADKKINSGPINEILNLLQKNFQYLDENLKPENKEENVKN